MVIAILAILALIAIPRLTGFQETARIRADASNVKILDDASAMWVASDPSTNALSAVTMGDLTGDDLIDAEPEDPWGESRSYATDASGYWQPLGIPTP